jgi:hypothetical protein
MTVPVQPLSKALGSIRVDRSRSNVGTTEALGRQPKVVSQIKPHEHAALVGGPPSFVSAPHLSTHAVGLDIGRTDQDRLQIQIKDLRLFGNYSSRQPPEPSDSTYRWCPRPIPMLLAFARSALSVRFVSLAIFLTGVRAFECARNSFSSALVYSRRTRFFTLCVPKIRFGVDAASGRRKLAS